VCVPSHRYTPSIGGSFKHLNDNLDLEQPRDQLKPTRHVVECCWSWQLMFTVRYE